MRRLRCNNADARSSAATCLPGKSVRRGRLLLLLTLLIAVGAIAAASVYARRSAERQLQTEAALAAREAASRPVEREVTSELVVGGGSNFADLLHGMEFDDSIIGRVTAAARPVFNFRRLRQGNRLTVTRSSQGSLESISYEIDRDHELWIAREGDDYKADVREVPSTVKVQAIAGEVHGSLFDSIMEAGEQPVLALRLAEIFAWDLDFYTDPRPGDTFRVVLEKREYSNGQQPSYGRILAAEYENAGRPYRAVLFHDRDGRPGYYSADGKSLQKAFLRSPLKFAARVSSHFSRHRFHPILKIYRPHLGTDYAAPTGTPVQAVAGGVVVFSGRNGGGGNVVEIRHERGYMSYYMHLFRRLVRSGQRVKQGQRIGLVGATGLATGPHLDFRLRRHGAFVNFERMKLLPAYPVARSDWSEFVATREKWMPLLAGAVAKNNRETPTLASAPAPASQ